MCPACIATATVVVAGATSAGGLATLVVKKLRAGSVAMGIEPKTQNRGDQDGSSESRVAG